MQRADAGDVERCGLLKQGLYVYAVLADDVDEVASGLILPRHLHVEGAGREESFGALLVCHHHFGPVYHRRHDELEGMAAETERIALGHDDAAVGIVRTEELCRHGEGLGAAHNAHRGEAFHRGGYVCGVVGFHVQRYEVVGCAPRESLVQTCHPLVTLCAIDRIHKGYLLVEDEVGVVRYTVGHTVLTLEEVDGVVVDADVFDGVCDGDVGHICMF